MAMMIRNENELATLRCSIQLSGRQPQLVTQAFIGAERIGDPVLTPLDALGLRNSDQPFSALKTRLETEGASILLQIEHLHYEIAENAAIWLQLSQDSYLTALLPWEQIISEKFNRTTLRIPNFLRTPYRVKDNARLAICTSGAGSDEIGLPMLLARHLAALDFALQGSKVSIDVTIFAPADDRSSLKSVLQSSSPKLKLTVAEPPSQPQTADFANPWLNWISTAYQNTGVDGVSFIAPGHLSGGDSAIVLPDQIHPGQPIQNQFIGLSELADFYDYLGCPNMCFVPVGSEASKNGTRVMGYQMSWTRPGSLIVDEAAEDPLSLASALRATWTRLGLEPSRVMSTPAYLHPSLTNLQGSQDVVAPHPGYDEELTFVQSSDPVPPEPKAVLDKEIDLRSIMPGILGDPKPRAGLEIALPKSINIPFLAKGLSVLAQGVVNQFRRTSQPQEQMASSQNANQMIQNERAKFSSVKTRTELEQARDEGALDALDFLEGVLKQ